ncbi:hypothetical protein ACFCY8_25390 [Streptomyces noursei]|uniref:hypothetical protein n=1 Tax=Streptomyces noursei TaxID=1971 RepID=UPI0035D9B422
MARYRTEYGALDELATSAADVIADLHVWAVANGLGSADWHAVQELRCSACGRTDPAALNDDVLRPACAT